MPANGDDVIEKLERVDKPDAIDKKFDDLINANKIQFEKVREDLKKLGEGYEQGLKQISQQLKDLEKKWSEKWRQE